MKGSRTSLLLITILSLCSCQSKLNPPTTDYERPKIEKSDNSVYDEEPDKREESDGKEDKPSESAENFGKYKIKFKGPTKTLEGSIDISEEKQDLLHLNTGKTGTPSLFHPELFEKDDLMVLQTAYASDSYEYTIIPLGGEKLKVEKTFNTFYAPPEVEKGPGKGEFIFSFQEPYPEAGGARTVAPYVIANYKDGKMTLDTKAMKEHGKGASLGSKETIKDAFEVHQDNDTLPPEFVSEIIDRYYIGKAKEARKLFDQSWPKKRKGKEKSWNEIIEQMKESPYWPQIKAMNKL